MRWLALVLIGCSGPSPMLDDGGADGSVEGALELRVRTVQGGGPVEGPLTDGTHTITELTVGLDRLEWKTDVSDEVYVDEQRTVDLLGGTTIPAMMLPPGRYSEVELELREGAWGAPIRAVVDGVAVETEEDLDLDARCEEPLELGIGEEVVAMLEVDGDLLLEILADRETDPLRESLREALSESLRLVCR